jgi:protein gp37
MKCTNVAKPARIRNARRGIRGRNHSATNIDRHLRFLYCSEQSIKFRTPRPKLIMGQKSRIEWTDATWNPTTGCTKVSAGCDNCYAHALAHGRLTAAYLRRLPVLETPENLADPFAVRLWPERLAEPGKWKEPRMIFVNSMSDLFHADIPDAFIRRIFQAMLSVDRHIYQVLTKRPARMGRFVKKNRDLFPDGEVPDHIWMGTSVEDQKAVFRVGHLRQVPARVRFLS